MNTQIYFDTTMVLTYCAEVVFNMLVLSATVKMSDRVIRDMLGI